MRILHDVKDTLTVSSSTAETIQEVCQSIFVQGTSDEQAHHDGSYNYDGIWHDYTAEIERGSHRAASEPTREWPPFHDSGV